MTIIYQYKVATTSFLGFFKLLASWRGSVYKLMFKETLIFCALYTLISLIYRLALDEHQRHAFEKIASYCNEYTSLIPISFVLGFYVSIVVHRWWQQFTNVPWPDRTLFILGSYLTGQEERARILRRSVARYMLFGLILILRSISVAVMKRYPTLGHIVDAGFVTQDEVVMFERVNCKYNKFWVPLVWANSVLTQARREGKIDSEIGFRLVLEQLADFRDKCSLCFVYDWITIPLVYTQVVTLACHMFFAACLIGRQYLDSDDHPDLYFPFFTIIQFFFYMGWLKVAEQLINPFGEDDDDFDMNWLIDRHTAVAMCLVDQCHGSYPPLIKDIHFNEVVSDLPYTEASMASRKPIFLGSTYNLARPSVQEQRIISQSDLVNAAHPGLRQRADTGPRVQGSLGGSMWSLFGFNKSNLRKSTLAGSRDTIHSTTTAPPNGHIGIEHTQIDHSADFGSSELPPEYVPLKRARASTDADHRPLQRLIDTERERKWSFPLSLLRKRQEKDLAERRSVAEMVPENVPMLPADTSVGGGDTVPLLTPPAKNPLSRFVVETVATEHEDESSKQSRTKQLLDLHMSGVATTRPSRPPLLSAIEEGNTIRSISELLPSPSSVSLEDMHFPIDEEVNPDRLPRVTEIVSDDNVSDTASENSACAMPLVIPEIQIERP